MALEPYKFQKLEVQVRKKQDTRVKFDRLVANALKDYRIVNPKTDKFVFIDLPPGASEFLVFHPENLPFNSEGYFIFSFMFDNKLKDQMVRELNSDGKLVYHHNPRKSWIATRENFTQVLGIVLIIKASYAAKGNIIPKLGENLCMHNLDDTVVNVLKYLSKKFPNAELVSREFALKIIAHLQFSDVSEKILNDSLHSCIKPGGGSRKCGADEKIMKFTGDSHMVKDAQKREGMGSWTSDLAMETRFNEPFVANLYTNRKNVHLGQHHELMDYQEPWIDLMKEVGSEVTSVTTDKYYMSLEVLMNAIARGHIFASALQAKRFNALNALLAKGGNKEGEFIAAWNERDNILVMKYTSHDPRVKTKLTATNCLRHVHASAGRQIMNLWDAYERSFRLPDLFHRYISIMEGVRWPWRHGSHGTHGVASHLFDKYLCFIIENVKVAFRSLSNNEIEHPEYAAFVFSLGINCIIDSLR